MAGYFNPSLLEMAQGYQFGGRVKGRGRRGGRGRPPMGPPPPIAPPITPSGPPQGDFSMGPPQAMTPPPPPIAPPIAPSGVGGGVGGYSTGPPQGIGESPIPSEIAPPIAPSGVGEFSMGPPQSMTAGAYAGAPPSPISGGTSTMGEGMLVQGQATAPAGGVMTQTSAPAGGGEATPPGGGYDVGAYGTAEGIASEFGFDPSEFSQYFSAISPEMQAATQEATYDPYYKEQIGQLREQRGGAVAGLRQNLLQSVMQAQQASAGSGFAGGAAGGQQLLDLTRTGAESQYGDISASYGRGKYGVKEAISGRISGGRQAIEAAKRANIATASRLYQSGAGDLSSTADSDYAAYYDKPQVAGNYGYESATTEDTGPPGWPNAQAFERWRAAGSDPDEALTYGWAAPTPGATPGYKGG